jgi:hypothetical protein
MRTQFNLENFISKHITSRNVSLLSEDFDKYSSALDDKINHKKVLIIGGAGGIRRFFVSLIESGELCLMASVMGESGDIFYPKLEPEKDMIPFDKIAKDLLKTLDLEIDICKTEQEAKMKAKSSFVPTSPRPQSPNSRFPLPASWPVFFFGSNTSGEKSFEEFYTESETRDEKTFINLGVIKNSLKRNKEDIDQIFNQLQTLFDSNAITKESIVNILKKYLPNFEHIEIGKGLDSKM